MVRSDRLCVSYSTRAFTRPLCFSFVQARRTLTSLAIERNDPKYCRGDFYLSQNVTYWCITLHAIREHDPYAGAVLETRTACEW